MTTKTQFDQLVEDLETMAKALPAESGEGGDAQAAAGGGGGEGDNLTDEEKAAAAAAEKAEGEGGMAKSFEVTLPDGSKVQALDGAAMVKSLTDKVSGLESTIGNVLAAAVGMIKKQSELLTGQGTMIKSLQDTVEKIGGQGAGRRAVLSLVEKPATTLAKATEPTGMKPEEFMAKSDAAWKAGKISGQEIALIETLLNKQQAPDPALVQKVLTATASA